MGEEIFIKLRDCFTAGYTLPQFCIDNGIKNPLFVSEKRFELFLWEVYVQFRYDKRMTAQFGFLDADAEVEINYSVENTLRRLKIQPVSAELMGDCDKIIVLSADNSKIKSDITAYQPETYRNKIYFVGSCYEYGINAPFDRTVESYLQKLLNEHNLPYRVENEGQHYFGRRQDIFYNLNALKISSATKNSNIRRRPPLSTATAFRRNTSSATLRLLSKYNCEQIVAESSDSVFLRAA